MFRNRNFNVSLVNTLTIAAVAIGVLWLDQYTKHLVVTSFLPGESRMVIPHLLKWTYERNFHGAFGMFGSSAVLLIGMAIVVLVLFWFSFRDAASRSRLVRVAFGAIVGGAIGNIVDRLHYGYVIDFVDFYRIWPNIFNVADSCITVGVALLLLSSLASRRHH
ncbi:MAG: signal peptidase II [Candidatus Eremiobacteraeota bacterium]|nr:signal peptidase II [Candidatus Eremiobacteraeota bacterium]MBV8435352.1 signal peptidase II [Candidatus Eremiobacteraeota bacterium]MBV8655203.1 signal peptidase II [Candidatus Eremiobacteraeota bacterium]